MAQLYSTETYEVLFQQEIKERVNLKGLVFRTRTITAGKYKYVDVYPRMNRLQAQTARAARARASTKAQAKLNAWHSRMKLEQLINTNFEDGDLFITLTYRDEQQPPDYAAAMKDINKYLRKLRRLRERRELPELRYVYCIEATSSAARGTRYHFHLITGGDGIDRDEAEKLWSNGIANTRRCSTDENGLAGLAHYMGKAMQPAKEGCRRWNASRNLKKPTVTHNDSKMSARKVENIIADMETAGAQIVQKAYPGYQLTDDIYAARSEWLPGAYIRFKLRRYKT